MKHNNHNTYYEFTTVTVVLLWYLQMKHNNHKTYYEFTTVNVVLLWYL